MVKQASTHLVSVQLNYKKKKIPTLHKYINTAMIAQYEHYSSVTLTKCNNGGGDRVIFSATLNLHVARHKQFN